MNLGITIHCRERFVQRYLYKNRFEHLNRCRVANCEQCGKLKYQIRLLVKETKNLYDIISEKFHAAKETKIHLNNTEFMDHIYTKYGYGSFSFHVDNDLLFVVIDDEEVPNKKVLITCIAAKTSIAGDLIKRPKFGKKCKV